MDIEQHLTEENIRTTARVLQALDIKAGEIYGLRHSKEVDPDFRLSESDVAELADNITHELPGQIMLCDHHDFRIGFSIYVNMLIAMGMQEDCAAAIEERFKEMEEL